MITSIEKFRHYVQSLVSNERSSVHLDKEALLSIALVFPNDYEIGMANLGFQTLFRLLNSIPGVRCERAFFHKSFPDISRTIESVWQLNHFDIIAFSTSFELDYINIAKILINTGLNPLVSNRHPRDPLVIAGGTATFINPLPIAPFMDLIFLGEIEPVLEQLIEHLKKYKEMGSDKVGLLQQLSKMDGVYVPQFLMPGKTVVNISARDKEAGPQFSPVITPNSHFQDMFLIEVGRGCGRYCHFCAASHVYHPLRYFSQEKILTTVEKNIHTTKKVGLVGAALCDYPGLTGLCRTLVERGYQLGLSSFRFTTISPDFLSIIHEAGVNTITLAPEAGTMRMRRLIHKSISDEQIFAAIEMIAKSGISNLKLYFLIGLPFETNADIDGIAESVKTIRKIFFQSSNKKKEITVSVNAFIPKPFTPFQWAGMDTEKNLKMKRRLLDTEFRKIGSVKFTKKNTKLEIIQGIISLGDSDIAHRMIQMTSNNDYSVISSPKSLSVLFREKTEKEPFPWDFIEYPVSKAKLWRSWQEVKEKR